MTGHLLFGVFSEGKEYRIYTDGRVEGFGDRPLISNYYPILEAFALGSLRHQLQPSPSPAQAERTGSHRNSLSDAEPCA